eukprot:144742-Pyramimonas_sp.AAC.2
MMRGCDWGLPGCQFALRNCSTKCRILRRVKPFGLTRKRWKGSGRGAVIRIRHRRGGLSGRRVWRRERRRPPRGSCFG